eukprot:TRINITY_DN3051_c0_g1_i1.p1 TRINITY_DN3051_c0_g1~~TRINITY_DN3051_c0_g1_i1.p1  ORF type:complete len:729 (-),score=252.42 TRINITY_DN3051_c0_g1_i1:20-2137(-)
MEKEEGPCPALQFVPECIKVENGVETETENLVGKDGSELWSKCWRPLPDKAKVGTITFIQGIGEQLSRFESTLTEFAKAGFVVNGIDCRGHGKSNRTKNPPTLNNFLDDIQFLFKRNDSSLPHFILGYSLGSVFVSSILQRQSTSPDHKIKVDGIVLVSPLFVPPSMASGVKRMWEGFRAKVSPKAHSPTGISERYLSKDQNTLDEWRKSKTLVNLPRYTILQITEAGRQSEGPLISMTIPFMVIQGEKDRVTSTDLVKSIFEKTGSKDKISHSIPDSLHDVLHESSSESNRLIIKWLLLHSLKGDDLIRLQAEEEGRSQSELPIIVVAPSEDQDASQGGSKKPNALPQFNEELKPLSPAVQNLRDKEGTSSPVSSFFGSSFATDKRASAIMAEGLNVTPSISTDSISYSPVSGRPVPKKTPADFDFIKTIGQGAFGEVKLAKEIATDREFAVKMLDKKHIIDSGKKKYVHTERNIFNLLLHPNVVRLFFTFQDPKTLYYVLELCPNGDIASHLKRVGRFDKASAQFYTAEIVNALEHMHSKGVVHRDLKPDNILIGVDFHAKLTDFGTSKELGKDERARSDSFCGTAEYVSPELLNDEDPYCVRSSDLWALGCIIYQLICGKTPFKGETNYFTFELIKKGDLQFPEDFPEDAKDLVSKLLVSDSSARLGAGEGGYAALKAHRFFNGIDFEKLPEMVPPPIQPPV